MVGAGELSTVAIDRRPSAVGHGGARACRGVPSGVRGHKVVRYKNARFGGILNRKTQIPTNSVREHSLAVGHGGHRSV